MRRHEIKEVAVIRIEGHDGVDRLAGWELEGPLIGQGEVLQEGQLWNQTTRVRQRTGYRCAGSLD